MFHFATKSLSFLLLRNSVNVLPFPLHGHFLCLGPMVRKQALAAASHWVSLRPNVRFYVVRVNEKASRGSESPPRLHPDVWGVAAGIHSEHL